MLGVALQALQSWPNLNNAVAFTATAEEGVFTDSSTKIVSRPPFLEHIFATRCRTAWEEVLVAPVHWTQCEV